MLDTTNFSLGETALNHTLNTSFVRMKLNTSFVRKFLDEESTGIVLIFYIINIIYNINFKKYI